jgi:site-specific recombinase XerD
MKNKYAKEANVKQIRIHDFRHSCASVLINNGASIMIVAKYLGHSKIDQTLNTYSHLFKNKLDEIVQTLDSLE